MAKEKYPKDAKGKSAPDPKGKGKDWAKDDEKASLKGRVASGKKGKCCG